MYLRNFISGRTKLPLKIYKSYWLGSLTHESDIIAAIYYAILNKNLEIIKLLLKSGINVNFFYKDNG
jgi:hypothetical protein